MVVAALWSHVQYIHMKLVEAIPLRGNSVPNPLRAKHDRHATGIDLLFQQSKARSTTSVSQQYLAYEEAIP